MDYDGLTSKLLSESGGVTESQDPLMNRVEDKYLVSRSHLEKLTSALRTHLKEGESDTQARFNTTTTIYLDTKDLDCFRDAVSGVKPRFKVRIRHYAPNGGKPEDVAYLELKIKTEDGLTKKTRVRIPQEAIENLADGRSILTLSEKLVNLNRDVSARALLERVQVINETLSKYGFRKQICVSYERRAYADDSIRVTVDDHIRFFMANDLNEVRALIEDAPGFDRAEKTAERVKSAPYVILEVKHKGDVPGWLGDLMKDVSAEKVRFSKYCAAVIDSNAAYGVASGKITKDGIDIQPLMALFVNEPVQKSSDEDVLGLIDSLGKGGPGSGIKGHRTAQDLKREFGGAKNNPAQPYDEVSNVERKNRNTGEEAGEDKNRKVKPYTTSGSSVQDAREKNAAREHRAASKKTARTLTGVELEAAKKKIEAENAEREAKRNKVEKSMEDAKIISLIDRLNKGGPGSGVVGHVTAKKPSDLHPHVASGIAPEVNKLQSHIQALKHGVVMTGLNTKSGKPVVNDMDAARAHGYDVQDHVDAMNAHYELAQRTQAILEKLKTAGHKVPEEGKQIAQFHEKKMKEHMRARQYLEERKKHTAEAIKEKKAAAVKKSVTQMGSGLGDRDLDVGSFAQANGQGSSEWMEKLYSGMEGFEYGADPREFKTDKGTLHLAKVDDGIYSGYFTRDDDTGILDNLKIRIERITVPELVQFMIAKEWIPNHKIEVPEKVESPAIPEAELVPAVGLEPTPIAPDASIPIDQKIRLLELIAKLLG